MIKSIMEKTVLNIAIIGCGQISGQYGKHMALSPDRLRLIGGADIDRARAEAFTQEFGGKVFDDLDAILADPEVDTVVNLTIHHAHFEVNKKIIEAGKHVFSEKPLSLTYAEAQQLVDLAKAKNVRLGCAPMTFLGEAVQTAARFIQDYGEELLGTIRVAYAEGNWGQINTWIGSPKAYFSVGPHLDIGVYPLCILAYLFGSAERALGYSTILQKNRLDSKGDTFEVTAPDFNTGIIEFANGVKARLTTNYYVQPGKNMDHLRYVELHGDKGTLVITNCHNFNRPCYYIPNKGDQFEVPFVREPELGMNRAAGLVDMAEAIDRGAPHLASGEQAAHMTEILQAMSQSAQQGGGMVDIQSRFTPGELASWAQTPEWKFTMPEPEEK